ncbi:hypothetical protein D3C73_1056930 [compost metagenome]
MGLWVKAVTTSPVMPSLRKASRASGSVRPTMSAGMVTELGPLEIFRTTSASCSNMAPAIGDVPIVMSLATVSLGSRTDVGFSLAEYRAWMAWDSDMLVTTGTAIFAGGGGCMFMRL